MLYLTIVNPYMVRLSYEKAKAVLLNKRRMGSVAFIPSLFFSRAALMSLPFESLSRVPPSLFSTHEFPPKTTARPAFCPKIRLGNSQLNSAGRLSLAVEGRMGGRREGMWPLPWRPFQSQREKCRAPHWPITTEGAAT